MTALLEDPPRTLGLERIRRTPAGCCAQTALVRGYAVKFHVLVETKRAEYLRPETHWTKSFGVRNTFDS